MPDFIRTLASGLAVLKVSRWFEMPAAHTRDIEEPPLRAELFSALQMERHGRVLANAHQLSGHSTSNRLLERLAGNESALIGACALLREATRSGRQITPADEWMLDNFYLIEEQIRIARQHLPKNYSKELPRLEKGQSADFPRVYDIALEVISHGDGRIDTEGLSRFVTAYQQVTTLTLGELWAIPIMLRLALIENLRRVAARLATSRGHRDQADKWVDRMVEAVDKDPASLILQVADMARSDPPMAGAFVAELARRLHGQGPSLMLALTWLAQHLSEAGLTIETLIQAENQQQAADQVSVSNSIGSLRLLTSVDWRDFVEAMSQVEQTLRCDPSDTYVRMDFATRDRYRHIVERLSRQADSPEADVARAAIDLAQRGLDEFGAGDARAHVGYYLVDAGLPSLEAAIDVRLSWLRRLRRFGDKVPLLCYLGPVTLLTALFCAGLLQLGAGDGMAGWALAGSGVLLAISGSQLAISIVNWLVTLRETPESLPRMDFTRGVPDEYATLVVVPTMLFTPRNIEDLCDALEVRYLANRDGNIRFCLLTDLADAATETTDTDQALVACACRGIERLNRKYASNPEADDTDGDIFLLLHRPRQWNATEGAWIGHERKRGKLGDLNAFLCGGHRNPFSMIAGDTTGLDRVRYVITLDTDTRLERDSARRFVATMAHPLNRPVIDTTTHCVIRGYGILQPRVATSLAGSGASRYGNLYSDESGIDPYTRTVSDVYQDVFGEGSFTGKGIYDVRAFEQALAGRLPENRILSHDLLEGCYARSGLISDVQLHEEYPTRYLDDMRRRHRWIRGDWQIVSWLFSRVPDTRTRLGRAFGRRNPLSALSRWKILDNLRRSLVSSALLALVLLGWSLLPAPWLWTGAALAVLFLPAILASLLDLARKPGQIRLAQHLPLALRATRQRLAQAFLTLAFLPYDAALSLDAIYRSLWRLTVSHRHLLQWVPSSQAGAGHGNRLVDSYRHMAVSPVVSVAMAIILGVTDPPRLWIAVPFLWLWLIAPALSWWLSLPLPREEPRLSDAQHAFLQGLARRTWAFFDAHLGPDDNWLPPDNVQEDPVNTVAHRTSPTNMGLALLATLAARDFGYIPAGQCLERLDKTLAAMESLERHRGHFFNWYDTQLLTPLHPRYISTVDSGNLAGHLMTLEPGLLAMADEPVIHPHLLRGIADTFDVLCDTSDAGLHAALIEFRHALPADRALPGGARQVLLLLRHLTGHIDAFIHDPTVTAGSSPHEWALLLRRQCRDASDDLIALAPWSLDEAGPSANAPPGLPRGIPTFRELANLDPALQEIDIHGDEARADLARRLAQASREAADRIALARNLAARAVELALMDYTFLYNKTTRLLAIGYNATDGRLDPSYYDLLASEARLCSFVAIAQNQLPQENWFALSRRLTLSAGEPTLLSWSGSMFEYLMPMLVMPSYPNTLLDQTCHAVVRRQIEYGHQRGVPWGLSESAFYTFDASLNYQYRAFGVPGLGLKRGLSDDLVIAPYASMLALMVEPGAACENLRKMATMGFDSPHGFYEAVDYTPARLPRGKSMAVVKSFMAHHQGMGFLSLASVLLDQPMQRRFMANPLFQSAILLLQERIPRATVSYVNIVETSDARLAASLQELPVRVLDRARTRRPEVQLLSNGRYHVMLTNSGGGSSVWRDLAVTRWREDPTRDHWGVFCYVRDLTDGEFWSTTYHPTRREPDRYEVIFSEDRAEFRRTDHGVEMHTEIVVSPEDDIELRRTRITNRSRVRRTLDVTSYAEIVLAPAAADNAHPAFGKLFVQTEILEERHAILGNRRPRSRDEKPPWMLHLMTTHGTADGPMSFETDRARFIGPGATPIAPRAMLSREALSGTHGAVLDPIAAARCLITLEPGQQAVVDVVLGVADSRSGALRLIDKYQDRYLADRVFELAWTHNHVVLRQLNATDADARLFSQMAGAIVYANTRLRADPRLLAQNGRQQSGLWGYGISGDLPIVLLRLQSAENIGLARQLIQAHAYWRTKGLAVDLVIWNEDHASYRQQLQDDILGLIASGVEAQTIDRPGGIYVRMAEQIPDDDRILLQSVARLILSDDRGTLAEQIARRTPPESRVPPLNPKTPMRGAATIEAPRADLLLPNGLGGFSPDGREYVITTDAGRAPPVPWVNVLANPMLGSVVSHNGPSYTWYENAHEFRLTPWHNDPVSDSGGEAFYLRDDGSGHVWSPTPLPAPGAGPYVARHGLGYSVFEHTEQGIWSELTLFVALDTPVKYAILTIRNDTEETRSLSATGYVQWVLGDQAEKTALHVVTEADAGSEAILARNRFNNEFHNRTAFFDTDAATRTVTGDRSEFIGRNGSLASPDALRHVRLSGRLGAALDPCAAIQVPIELVPGQTREVIFVLGALAPGQDTRHITHLRDGDNARTQLDRVRQYWRQTTDTVQVRTPDPALDVLANGWLVYQTMACRLWARSGFYQSGGAYGFRDQLQDAMALVHIDPGQVREHLLRCAAHQFVEGDVQHWWHPPTDRGVRTHCSDDYLWLPLAVSRYVTVTDDAGVLDERIPFLEGRAVEPHEDSYYDLPMRSGQSASLYDHCARAIEHGLRFGAHGLPLMGSCDWNDGMDKVGHQGKGESVWLGFFLFKVLNDFARIAQARGDAAFAGKCREQAASLGARIEKTGWDGEWYRRAYFDDGTPLGSRDNNECRIDAISQSWAVLSGAGDTTRAASAMRAVEEQLVRRGQRLIQLLDPPFNGDGLDPGYIQGYVPGVRENGGQYTHAAIWTIMAFAEMGRHDTAWELLDAINPVNHTRTRDEVELYKVEPYVMAADVYAQAPHTGRGGWTWYTGSAGWMYRLIVES
ncbi:MAG TPA: glucoamylase family protein, partial [Burkholderiaceae bacterium]|nr:glucoamylase family protein [Burkholderiaceae bacterium]